MLHTVFFLIFDSVAFITSKHCLFYFRAHFGCLLNLGGTSFLTVRREKSCHSEHLAKTLLGAVPDLYRRKLTRSREFMCAVRLRDETFPFFFNQAPAIVPLPCTRLRITRFLGFPGARNVSLLCINDRSENFTTDVRPIFLETAGTNYLWESHFCRLEVVLFLHEKYAKIQLFIWLKFHANICNKIWLIKFVSFMCYISFFLYIINDLKNTSIA